MSGRCVVVVGAARSGVAAAELLVRRGARVTVTDVKPSVDAAEHLLARGITLELGGHQEHTLASADLVVVSPGVPLGQPALHAARRAGVPIVGELELASRWLRGRIVAITGTKGKSTTTTLAGRMLERSGMKVLVGGNIGVPVSAQVDVSTADTIHVLEASSFQLETTWSFHPWIAALLNFSPDHLDQHPSVEAYAAAKSRIFARQVATDFAVVNADDPATLAMARGTAARQVRFGLSGVEDGYTVSGDAIVWRSGTAVEPLAPLSAVRVMGRHLLSDVVAATAIGHLAGARAGAVVEAVEGFEGLEHAMERVREIEGVWFVNDSKATNVEAARRSIESAGARPVAIVGGRYKGGDFARLAEPLREQAGQVVAIGEAAGRIDEALGSVTRVVRAAGMAEAVRVAFELAAGAGTVLLAPGCSSFDMFRDYAERGRVFKEEVRRLADERRATREQ